MQNMLKNYALTVNNVALYLWSETVPNWLMALSAVSAAVVFLWRRQDRQEARAAREAGIRSAVNAVWVTARIGSDQQDKWGILVTNTLQVPVNDLEVTCSGNSGSTTLIHPSVQPGKHFFESLPHGKSRAWDFPTSSIASFEYITASKKHVIQQVSFMHSGTHYSNSLTENP